MQNFIEQLSLPSVHLFYQLRSADSTILLYSNYELNIFLSLVNHLSAFYNIDIFDRKVTDILSDICMSGSICLPPWQTLYKINLKLSKRL